MESISRQSNLVIDKPVTSNTAEMAKPKLNTTVTTGNPDSYISTNKESTLLSMLSWLGVSSAEAAEVVKPFSFPYIENKSGVSFNPSVSGNVISLKGTANDASVIANWGANIASVQEIVLDVNWSGVSSWGNKGFKLEINGQPVSPPGDYSAGEDFFKAGSSNGSIRIPFGGQPINKVSIVNAAGTNLDVRIKLSYVVGSGTKTTDNTSTAKNSPSTTTVNSDYCDANCTKLKKVTPATIKATADMTAVKQIQKASADIWNGTTPFLRNDVQLWANKSFASLEDFQQFMVNWANVETGGNYNRDHQNTSHPVGRAPESNYGVFQINERWAVRHDTWGHDSNPLNWNPSIDAKDPYKATHWALNHLMGFSQPARGNIAKMLEGYWHGIFGENSHYAEGVFEGHIISEQE